MGDYVLPGVRGRNFRKKKEGKEMNGNCMKKRWISLYVENQVGVLSKISGLFSGKSYNLDSLTVGTTEDPTVSRMTIATVSDDETFEQIKKQLNRLVEVIKVIDFTDVFVRMKEGSDFGASLGYTARPFTNNPSG